MKAVLVKKLEHRFLRACIYVMFGIQEHEHDLVLDSAIP
jgi:hypothetical protein